MPRRSELAVDLLDDGTAGRVALARGTRRDQELRGAELATSIMGLGS